MKGFIFLYGSEILLRFVTTGAFHDLNNKHEIIYVSVASSELMQKEALVKIAGLERQHIEVVPFYSGRHNRWGELFDISCITYQDISSSFKVRYQESKKSLVARYATLEEYSSPQMYEARRKEVENDMGLHPDILKLTLKETPDFFVLPSGILDYATDDVLQIADFFSIPTLMLVSGWDNLSSKGLLFHKPTRMGVWGKQSKRHAIDVQKMSKENVDVIGAPHYETFFENSESVKGELRAELGVPQTGKLILFAGTFRLFDETILLQEQDRAIEGGELPDMHVIYRPHPWRSSRTDEESFFSHEWKHVTMDSSMVYSYKESKNGQTAISPDNFLFRLSHLKKLYQAVDAVISPMSTVLLESLLFGLPTMAVAFGDGKHSWSADKVSKMMHFNELYEMDEVIVCRARDEFSDKLIKLLELTNDPKIGPKLQASVEYMLYSDQDPYSKRVLSSLEKMFGTSRPPEYHKSAKVGKKNQGLNEQKFSKIIARLIYPWQKLLQMLKIRLRK